MSIVISTSEHSLNKQASTITSELTANLRDAIITGEIAQGSKLSETKLAQELDVSRGPLREALRNLEGMKLIHHVPQLGARVVSLNREVIMQIYEAREALESKAAALAAKNMTSSEIDELHRIIDAQGKHMRDSAGAFLPAESDYDFHESLIRGSKNKIIEHALIYELYNLIKMFRYQNDFAHHSSTNALIEHRQVVYAIEQRDPELAETVVRRHIVHARENFNRQMQTN